MPIAVSPARREIRNLQKERPLAEFKKAEKAARVILKKTDLRPKIGMILGSGLGAYADDLAKPTVLSYSDIPYFPIPSTIGHGGRLVIGEKKEIAIAALQGRIHMYEGLKLDQVVFPVRVLARMVSMLRFSHQQRAFSILSFQSGVS